MPRKRAGRILVRYALGAHAAGWGIVTAATISRDLPASAHSTRLSATSSSSSRTTSRTANTTVGGGDFAADSPVGRPKAGHVAGAGGVEQRVSGAGERSLSLEQETTTAGGRVGSDTQVVKAAGVVANATAAAGFAVRAPLKVGTAVGIA